MRIVPRGEPDQHHRLVILTDMENEPDDAQTMVRLLMYSNEIDIEGLIAVTSRWVQDRVFPESILTRVQALGVIRDNLVKHAAGWPAPDYLESRIAGGQLGFGMNAVGDGMSTEGSELILSVLRSDDPRPVWFAINAGANTLAQALWDARRTLSGKLLEGLVRKIRVYDDSGQDNAGAWIAHEFPELFYIRSRAQVFGLYGPTFDLGPEPCAPLDQYMWAEVNVRVGHGILGALYPQRLWFVPPWNASPLPGPLHHFLEGGGTATWLGLVNKGLCDPEEIAWGGWGGRLSWDRQHVPAGQQGVSETESPYEPFVMYPQDADDSFKVGDPEKPVFSFSGVDGDEPYYPRDFAPLWRWRDAYTRDFRGRMDWCVQDYEHANHHPVPVLQGDGSRTIVRIAASAGETFELDASDSHDPDGDGLEFSWYQYPEAGTYADEVTLPTPHDSRISVRVPRDAAGTQIHVILELTDDSPIVPLTAYRRIVIDVGPLSRRGCR